MMHLAPFRFSAPAQLSPIGLPFTVILLIMTWGLLKGLTHERKLLLQRGELL